MTSAGELAHCNRCPTLSRTLHLPSADTGPAAVALAEVGIDEVPPAVFDVADQLLADDAAA